MVKMLLGILIKAAHGSFSHAPERFVVASDFVGCL